MYERIADHGIQLIQAVHENKDSREQRNDGRQCQHGATILVRCRQIFDTLLSRLPVVQVVAFLIGKEALHKVDRAAAHPGG